MTRMALGLAAALVAGPLAAADLSLSAPGPQLGLGVGFSTLLGPTLEPTLRFGRFGLRAPVGGAEIGIEDESAGDTYEGSLQLGGAGLLADYYPFGNGFHVSAGLLRTAYGASLTGSDIAIDGAVSDIDVSFDQRRPLSPVLSLGTSGPLFGQVGYAVSAGAMFFGGLDVTARDPSGVFTQAQVDAGVQDFRDRAESMDVVPFVQVGIGLSF